MARPSPTWTYLRALFGEHPIARAGRREQFCFYQSKNHEQESVFMNFKKTLVALAAASVFSAAVSAEKLSVAATPVPHAELLEFVKPQLAEQGVELDVKVFTDYIQPNIQVDQKRMDANFFQHQPYLDEFNDGRGTSLVTVAGIHVEPFGAYSSKIESLDELKEGAVVAIPNDPTNGGRALLLLQKAGLITLKDKSKITTTRSEEHTSELQSRPHLVCRLLLEKKKKKKNKT